MMPPVERIRAILKTKSVLGRLADDVLDDLARRARLARYVKGEVLYRRGDQADNLMVILSGRARACRWRISLSILGL